MRFAVVTPDPADWIHVRAFDEVAGSRLDPQAQKRNDAPAPPK